MANEEQLQRLHKSVAERNGCEAWNRWKRENIYEPIDLTEAFLNHAALMSVNLSEVNLRRAILSGADLRTAVLSKAILSEARLGSAYLHGADITNADLSLVDLRGADLSETDLSLSDFSDADLSGADLKGAILLGANFSEAKLGRVDLRRANFNDANFNLADLTGADLSGADLRGVNFSGAILKQARFDEAICNDTLFAHNDLRMAQGLENIQHQGPSRLSVDTLYLSQGNIPDSFLRGCGVSDEWITYIHALQGAIQYYSAFISYNHEDETFATRLYNDLQANNVRCWKYTEDMRAGDKILQRVDEAIRLHDKLVIVFSKHAVQSRWVAGEVESALRREEREKRQVLFPVMIDNTVMDTSLGWASDVRRERHILDFTQWHQQQAYQPMFERFLRDLKQITPRQ